MNIDLQRFFELCNPSHTLRYPAFIQAEACNVPFVLLLHQAGLFRAEVGS